MTSPVTFTVAEFCEGHGRMSRTLFYKMVQEGKGPRLMKVGRRTIVSAEAAADWRKEIETATAGPAGASWLAAPSITS